MNPKPKKHVSGIPIKLEIAHNGNSETENVSSGSLDTAYRYAWNWFKYHAEQRLTAFHFFLLTAGAIFTGYGAQRFHPKLQLLLAAMGGCVSFAFLMLDIRNEELVNYGREALEHLESSHQIVGIEVARQSRRRSKFWCPINWCYAGENRCCLDRVTTHRWWLRILELLAIIFFLILAIHCLSQINIPLPH